MRCVWNQAEGIEWDCAMAITGSFHDLCTATCELRAPATSSFLLPPNRLVPRGTRCVGRVGGWDPRDFLHAGVRPERSGQCRVDGQAIRSVHDGHVGIRWVLVVDGEPTSSLTGSLWVWVWVWVWV